jgi:UDP-N-acetyl-D-mannosaminuronic acid dehydrogenase
MEKVAIFGLGFVGLPLALTYAYKGCSVIGVDISKPLIDSLKAGKTDSCEKFDDASMQEVLQQVLASKNFTPTTDPEVALSQSDYVIVTVGIPILEEGVLDFSMLDDAARMIGKGLRKGMTIVLRSTVPPKTTQFRFKPILEEESHMVAGIDFYLGYSSERMAEGKAYEELTTMPTPVAGINPDSLGKTEELLKMVCSAVIPVDRIEVVEMSKVVENLSRDVNIAMVNEFALYANSLQIDMSEVVKVANTHKRVKLLSPGPGVGGYCIPNAFYYLDGVEVPSRKLPLCKLSREINEFMPDEIFRLAVKAVKSRKKEAKASIFAIFGMGMKDFSNDQRHSPSMAVLENFRIKGYLCRFYDPLIKLEDDRCCETLEDLLEGADCLLILAKQDEKRIHDLCHIKKLMNGDPVIVDTRNLYSDQEAAKKGFLIIKI